MTTVGLLRDLGAFSVQVAIVAAAVAVFVRVVRLPPRARYVCLRLALAACLMLPWALRVPAEQTPSSTTGGLSRPALAPAVLAPQESSSVGQDTGATPVNRAVTSIPWTDVIIGVLLFGAASRALWLGIGLWRLRRLRARAVAVALPEYAELQQQLGTSAAIAHVVGLTQPATFGLRRPVVLLPETLATAPEPLRRAVVAHELLHVRRRDWVSVLAEECVRTALWFHPAIFWLTSAVQLAREQIVDELSVRLTGDRRTYMQALLAFADSAGLRPAPAFAHRRQLFHRLVSVSKEKVMSAPRIVMSATLLVVAVIGSSWYASSVFPIVAATPAAVITPVAHPPVQESITRGPDPGAMPVPDVAVTAAWQQDARAGSARSTPYPVSPENPIPRLIQSPSPVWPPQFADRKVQAAVSVLITVDQNGAVTAVDTQGCAVAEGSTTAGGQDGVCVAFAEATAAAVRRWRYEPPTQAPTQFNVVVSFRPQSEPAITQSGTLLPITASGGSAGPTLLPDVRAQLTELLGTREPVRVRLAELTAQYRELERAQRLAIERNAPSAELLVLQQRMSVLNDQLAMIGQDVIRGNREPLATIGPPTADASRTLVAPSGRQAYRVGGQIPPPRVLEEARPIYTSEAMAARVEGTVVMEALIDENGRVADARVLRSIPLLDQSARETLKYWRFMPTMLNGDPVPVIVQIEMHFRMR